MSFVIIDNLGEAFLRDQALRNSGNNLYFEPVSSSDITYALTLNLDSLWQKYQSKIEVLLPEPKKSTNESQASVFVFIAVALFLFISGLVWFFYRKNNIAQIPMNGEQMFVQETPSAHYYRALIASEQASLTMKELDQLLGIDYMEADSRKLRRHRLLQELQETYPGLINRIKDEKDRRTFLYRVRKDA